MRPQTTVLGNELRNSILEDEDLKLRTVGKLFLDLGFEPLAHNKTIGTLGEVDLMFRLQRDSSQFVCLVEVSSESSEQNQKIDHFLSRWSNARNLGVLFGELHIGTVKSVRVYFDLSRKTGADLTSVGHHNVNSGGENYVLFKDDLEYFRTMFSRIGQWARSDLLSLLHVPMSQTSIRISAIQFYLNSIPTFCFVSDVRTLLDACYISRRLGERRGYQRALKDLRVKSLGREIADRSVVAFPNSILINCEEQLVPQAAPPQDCPKSVEIQFPTGYCSSCVVDGQHRLLGFSRMSENELSQRHLPVVAFQKLSQDEEVKLFIEINSKQERIDSNLIYDLKADFAWDPENNYREFSERIIVLVARELSKKGPLRNGIFFGGAKETKGGKITLSTFVSVLEHNHLIGGKWHFWQPNPRVDSIQEPLSQTRRFFSTVLWTFKNRPGIREFLLSNVGLRILFRTVQILERNAIAGTFGIETDAFLRDLRQVLDPRSVAELRKLYGEGGQVEGSRRIVHLLKRRFTNKYDDLEFDFRRLRLQPTRNAANTSTLGEA